MVSDLKVVGDIDYVDGIHLINSFYSQSTLSLNNKQCIPTSHPGI